MLITENGEFSHVINAQDTLKGLVNPLEGFRVSQKSGNSVKVDVYFRAAAEPYVSSGMMRTTGDESEGEILFQIASKALKAETSLLELNIGDEVELLFTGNGNAFFSSGPTLEDAILDGLVVYQLKS